MLGSHWVGGARWAASRDLRALRVRRPGRVSRLVLGRATDAAGGRPAPCWPRRPVIPYSWWDPPSPAKPRGLGVPAILEWRGPVIATSVKDDLAAATLGHRTRQGPCWVFDPTRTSGLRPLAGWSPLAGCPDWSAAQRLATWLVEATPARSGMADAAFWYAAAAKQLAPLLLAAACGEATHGGRGALDEHQ